jgi:putative transposase
LEKKGSDGIVGEAFRPPATARPSRVVTRKRNRLSLDVYQGPGRFFLTITTQNRRPWFRQPQIVRHCAIALRKACEEKGFTVEAYCFMPDHLHLLVLTDAENDLIRMVHRFKQQTGWWFRNRCAAGGLKASPTSPTERSVLWQKSYYDHVLRQDEDVREVIRYILENPIRAGLVESANDYPYSWSTSGVPEPA